jgi:hypothetical protein
MGQIEVEVGEDQNPPFPCQCCGNLSHSSYGYLYSDGSAHAVYFARWTEHHDNGPRVTMLISLGEWGTDHPRLGARVCMALLAWTRDDGVVYSVLNAGDTSWATQAALGTMLTRDEALAHPYRDEFFHLAEHVTAEDPAIDAFLRRADQ